MDSRRKISKVNEKRKRKKVIKSKRWRREEQRRKGGESTKEDMTGAERAVSEMAG